MNGNLERELKRESGVKRITSLKDVKKIEEGIINLRRKHNLVFNDVYRGLSKACFTLKPTIGVFADQNNIKTQEQINKLNFTERMLARYIRMRMNTKGIDFIQNTKNKALEGYYDWWYLAQFRHLGLISRLMDWSGSIYASLYFAVQNSYHWGQDGKLWILFWPKSDAVKFFKGHLSDSLLDELEIKNIPASPLDYTSQNLYIMTYYIEDNNTMYVPEQRREKQNGVFFIQPFEKCFIPLEAQAKIKNRLICFQIDGAKKKEIFEELSEWYKEQIVEGYLIEFQKYKRDYQIHQNPEKGEEITKEFDKKIEIIRELPINDYYTFNPGAEAERMVEWMNRKYLNGFYYG